MHWSIVFTIIWVLLGLTGYVWINYHLYNKHGEVSFDLNDLWIFPLSLLLGPAMLLDVAQRINGGFNFTIRKKNK